MSSFNTFNAYESMCYMKYYIYILGIFLLINCSIPKQADYAILNVQVIDVESGEISSNNFIAIKDDRIVMVDYMDNHKNVEVKKSFDGGGAFVIPGLWDNHVHFRGGEDLINQNKNMLPLFLRYGVTSVRDGGGDITSSIQTWNQQIQSGELNGPKIYTSGPKLDGSRPAWLGSLQVESSGDVISALDSLQSINADFVKIYDGNLDAEMYYQIIQEAEKRGLKVTGHMPLTAELMDAVDYGLDGIEHLYYALTETAFKADSIRKAYSGYSMITPLMDHYDDELAFIIYTNLAEKEFYVTPTLHIGKTLGELNITDHSEDSLLPFIATEILETYQRRILSAARGGERYTQQRTRWGLAFSAMVKPMNDAGIHILAGSDCGPFNSYVYPGESIHKELELLVNSGLSPLEALQTSVINGPKFFNLSDDYGGIEAGKVADLLFLSQNPLESISNTQTISWVIQNGKMYSLNDLQNMMDSVKSNIN